MKHSVVKGKRRQPGQAKGSINKRAGSDPAPRDGDEIKRAPGAPATPSGVSVSGNMDGHGNAGLSGTP